MKYFLEDLWDLIREAFISLAKGVGRMVVIILSATIAGAVLGAGYGFFAPDPIVTTMTIGAVIGFLLSIAILIYHAMHGPY